MVSEERRSFPRIRDEGLALRLNAGDFDTITHTLNLSVSGVYCKVTKEIPLMSRVKLVLMLSGDEKAAKGMEVDGVVVREHPVIIDGVTKHYDVAIFFDSLSPKAKEMISDYISKNKKD